MFTGKILSFLFLMLGFHPIHISVTNMDYDLGKQIFEVSFKIFWDDFETIIWRSYDVNLKLTQPDESNEKELYFSKYIISHFIIKADEDFLHGSFKKGEIKEASIWLDFSFPCSSDIKKIEIENHIMMDMFDDQTNLLMFRFKEVEKAFSIKQGKEIIAIDLIND